MNHEYSGKKISTFKDRFNLICSDQAMSASSLADALHVSKQTISSWRVGTRSPKLPTILSIAQYFRINVEWLMGFDVSMSTADPGPSDPASGCIVVPDNALYLEVINALSAEDLAALTAIYARAFEKIKKEK